MDLLNGFIVKNDILFVRHPAGLLSSRVLLFPNLLLGGKEFK
jgi:hypothetical protein